MVTVILANFVSNETGSDLLGVTSDRKLVMELQCNMTLRWFVGLNLDCLDAEANRRNARLMVRVIGVASLD